MPIVRCPSCQKRYDPGMDDTLESFANEPPGVSLSLKVVCPACGQWLRLPELEAIPAPGLPPDILEAMKTQSRLVGDDEPDTPPAKKLTKPWWKFWA